MNIPPNTRKTNTSFMLMPATSGAQCSLLIQLLVVFSGDQEDFCLLKRILWRSVGLGALSTNMSGDCFKYGRNWF